MHWDYSAGPCHARLIRLPEGYGLSRILTEPGYRGEGWGSQVMRQICDDADREGVTLLVVPLPYADSPFGREELFGWYARFGFTGRGRSPIMTRVPRRTGQ